MFPMASERQGPWVGGRVRRLELPRGSDWPTDSTAPALPVPCLTVLELLLGLWQKSLSKGGFFFGIRMASGRCGLENYNCVWWASGYFQIRCWVVSARPTTAQTGKRENSGKYTGLQLGYNSEPESSWEGCWGVVLILSRDWFRFCLNEMRPGLASFLPPHTHIHTLFISFPPPFHCFTFMHFKVSFIQSWPGKF